MSQIIEKKFHITNHEFPGFQGIRCLSNIELAQQPDHKIISGAVLLGGHADLFSRNYTLDCALNSSNESKNASDTFGCSIWILISVMDLVGHP